MTPSPQGAEVGQLPHNSRPSLYRIDLRPDLSRLTFAGNETIATWRWSARPWIRLVLNAPRSWERDACCRPGRTRLPWIAVVQFGSETPRDGVPALSAGALEPGTYTLSLDFSGHIGSARQGLYFIRYGNHREHILLGTDLEPSDCRRIFPLLGRAGLSRPLQPVGHFAERVCRHIEHAGRQDGESISWRQETDFRYDASYGHLPVQPGVGGL